MPMCSLCHNVVSCILFKNHMYICSNIGSVVSSHQFLWYIISSGNEFSLWWCSLLDLQRAYQLKYTADFVVFCFVMVHWLLVLLSVHSVESPSMVDPQWNIWYWGSKWNLHIVCWGSVGCEWGTAYVYFQKISCWFKIWMGFVGPTLIKLGTSSSRGFLWLSQWWPLGS